MIVYEPLLYHVLQNNMVTERICSNKMKIGCFYKWSWDEFPIFCGIWDDYSQLDATRVVAYPTISYPTRTRGSVLLQRAVERKVWIEGEYRLWVRLGRVNLKPALCAPAWRQRYEVPTVSRCAGGENRGRIETPTLLSRLEKPILFWKKPYWQIFFFFVYELPNF